MGAASKQNKSKRNANSGGNKPTFWVHNRKSLAEYRRDVVEYTRDELKSLWSYIAKHPKLLHKTKWFQERGAHAEKIYQEDLKRMGLSKVEQLEALRQTGHENAYMIDIYVYAIMIFGGALILYLTLWLFALVLLRIINEIRCILFPIS